jgi:predicted AAA+ superfamily ATPase
MLLKRILQAELERAASEYPVVTIVGPRQAGKTTLARMTFPDKPYYSLENPDTRSYAIEDPRGFLAEVSDGAILDEIQRTPELLSYLQGMVDDDARPGRFILTGSQHFLLMQNVSQSLAGRTALLTLLPLAMEELQDGWREEGLNVIMQKGFYPRIHDKGLNPYAALRDYFQTYVERDVRSLLKVHDLHSFETFVRLCAGRVGQLLNLTSLANDAGISATTAREWVNILETSFILHRLQPWHANVSKRLIKSPKLYFHDVGLAVYLCGIEEPAQLERHPLRGNLFENMVVSELLKTRYNHGRDHRLCFFRDRTGNEVDVLYPKGPEYVPVEIKSGQTVSSDWFKGFSVLKKTWSQSSFKGIVVYGGREFQSRSKAVVCGVEDIGRALQEAGN